MIPQYKLRRLAARAIRVAQDHTAHPSIGLVKDLLTDTAREYISAYDDTSALQKRSLDEYAQGRDAMARFRSTVAELVPALKMHMPGFTLDVALVGVPDDMFESVSVLIDTLSDLQTKPEVVTTSIIPALEAALTEAEKEWREAEASRVSLQESQARLRDKAAPFYHNLKLFRRTLAGALGRAHHDYRKLRDMSAGIQDEDDPAEPAEPAAPTPPTPPVE